MADLENKTHKTLQIVVPYTAADEIEKLAVVEGITVSAWVRRLILQALGINGDGKKVRRR